MAPLNNNRGVSLVEILVGIAIVPIILAGVAAAFLSMEGTYSWQTHVTGMQQNARLAMHALIKDIMPAGYGMADLPPVSPILQYNGGTSTYFTFYPINRLEPTGTDIYKLYDNSTVNVLPGTDTIGMYYNSSASQTQVPVSIADQNPSSVTAANNKVSDASQLTENDYIVIYDTSTGKAVMYYVTGINPNNEVVTHAPQGGMNPPGGTLTGLPNWVPGQSMVINMNLTGSSRIAYYIDLNRNLIRAATRWVSGAWQTTSTIVASNIEDMQVEYLFRDGTVLNQPSTPTVNSVTGAVTQTDPAHDPSQVRKVTVSILARSEKSDPKYTDSTVYQLNGGQPHSGGGFRRMILNNEISLRNLKVKDYAPL